MVPQFLFLFLFSFFLGLGAGAFWESRGGDGKWVFVSDEEYSACRSCWRCLLTRYVGLVSRYYEGGVSSVYFWDLDDGFAGVVLLKKSESDP